MAKEFTDLILSVCGILIFIVAIFSAAYGTRYNWPDNVHVNYGFPLVWATHTLSSFLGPVDEWRVDISMLAIDLTIWLVVFAIAVAITSVSFRRLEIWLAQSTIFRLAG